MSLDVANLIISIVFLLIALGGFAIAWGRLQQWKENIDKDIIDIKDDNDKLNLKLYMKDGTPSYITSHVCKANMERINENLINYKNSWNEKYDSMKISLDNVSHFQNDFKAMYQILGEIIQKIDSQKEN